jgi:SAM-dependent methyltransferase
MDSKKHYDQEYFDWQRNIEVFGGKVNNFAFKPYISNLDNVLDFGCGGGYILANIPCKNRMGIEINPVAREAATAQGIKTVENSSQVEDDWADVIISNNVLEHTHNPLMEIQSLFPKLKKGGKIIFLMPCETIAWGYQPGDVNQHLFSWGPMTAGNLFTLAGYNVLESISFPYKWPSNYLEVFKKLNEDGEAFHEYARKYALKKEIKNLNTTWHHVKVVAERPL